jgi:hypothetical protein
MPQSGWASHDRHSKYRSHSDRNPIRLFLARIEVQKIMTDAQNTTLTAYHPRNHPLDCTYHVDQYPHECTCGLLNNSDEIISNVRCEKINDPMTPTPHMEKE